MKIRYFIFMVMSLLCLTQVGCHDMSYQGLNKIDTDPDSDNPQRVLMFLGTSASDSEGLKSKGTGPIVSADGFEGKTFNIYAFQKKSSDVAVSYSTLSQEDSFACLIDASIDEPGSKQGRVAVWNPESGIIDWKYSADYVFYPGGESMAMPFDFFAYYVDDMLLENEDFHRTDKSVEIDIEIDGYQDLMSAVAVAGEDELKLGAEDDEKEFLYRKQSTYSYYTAQLNIHPRFVFKHHLVKLDFKIVPGQTPEFLKDVRVEKLEVYSKNKANFVVAHKNYDPEDPDDDKLGLFFYNDKAHLELKEKDGSPFITRELSTIADGSEAMSMDLGTMLVAPDDGYYIYLTLSEDRDGKPITDKERNELYVYLGNLNDTSRMGFEAGSEYLITMSVYGKMDVRVSAELKKWGEGGDFGYDFDDISRPKN